MTPQTQKAVTFYGDTLIAIRQDDTACLDQYLGHSTEPGLAALAARVLVL